MGIFSEHAPKFWEVGIPAHPTKGKAGFVPKWNMLNDRMPSDLDMARWVEEYANMNVGIVLGIQAGLMMIDIDTEDAQQQAIILDNLPPSPWKRFGRKGMMLAYKYHGPEQRTCRIKSDTGETIVEILAHRTNVIVPPSIHPDTKKPYVENRPLYEIPRSEFPTLPRDIDAVLRGALQDAGYKTSLPGMFKVADFVPEGSRDMALTSHAGILSRSIMRGERSYVEAVDEMTHWVQNYTQKVSGDSVSEEKGRAKLHEFFTRDATTSNKALPIGWDNGLSTDEKKKLGFEFDEVEQWTCSRILTEFMTEAERITDPTTQEMINLVDRTLVRVKRSSDLSELEQDRILKTIYERTGKAVSMSALRKQLKLLRQTEIEGITHSEIAKSLYTELTKYSPIKFWNSKFYKWDGAQWIVMDEAEIFKLIQEDYANMPAARKFTDHKGIVSALAMFCKEDLKVVDRIGLNFANGFLDDDLTLHKHNPDFGMTYVLPYPYDASKESKCPQFFQLLEDAWGDDPDYEQKVMCLREAMAVTLMGRGTRYQRAICLYGIAGSGKTQILDVMQNLLPPGAVSHVRPESFSDRFNTSSLIGSLMNICGEISEHRQIPGDIFKQIIEGSLIQMQYKGKDPFSYAPKATHWFGANHFPKTRDTSAGFIRRWVFLEFNKKVPEDRKIEGLAQEIVANEREGITAWAVGCMPEFNKKKGYTLPSSHYNLLEELANSVNSVRFFLTREEVVRLGREAHTNLKKDWISERELHDAYYTFYVSTEGVRPAGFKMFKQMMSGLRTELQFKQEEKRNVKTNAMETIYRWITLVDGQKV